MREDLGGRSSPVVFQNRLYTIVRDKPATEEEAEKVVCVDAATGKTLWEHRFNMYLTDVPDERIGWSCPVVDPETGNVYVQGVSGYFCCLDGKTGKVIWDRSLHEEFGLDLDLRRPHQCARRVRRHGVDQRGGCRLGRSAEMGRARAAGPSLHGFRQEDRRAPLAQRHRHQPVRHHLQHADRSP